MLEKAKNLFVWIVQRPYKIELLSAAFFMWLIIDPGGSYVWLLHKAEFLSSLVSDWWVIKNMINMILVDHLKEILIGIFFRACLVLLGSLLGKLAQAVLTWLKSSKTRGAASS